LGLPNHAIWFVALFIELVMVVTVITAIVVGARWLIRHHSRG
jgi:hypothetical protein